MNKVTRNRVLRDNLIWLNAKFPLAAEVKVRFKKQNHHGECCFDGRDFVINLKLDLTSYELQATLIHEWAHAKVIENSFSHDSNWGIMHAAIYRELYGD